jgi:dUTP pyrophosphatase
MKLKIKRIDQSLPLPEYHTSGAVAFDLYAREQTIIPPFTPTLIPANFVIKTPKGHYLMLTARSSTAKKKGLIVFTGIIDQDYCGDEDELKISVLNFTKKNVTVEREERIAQGVLVKISKADTFNEVTSMSNKSRGGFGTTG